MAFDDIYDHIGGFGAFQIAIFFLLSLPCMYAGFQSLAAIFMVPDQDHWCRVEELVGLPYEQQKKVAIPYNGEDEGYEKCEYYDIDYGNYTVEELCSWDWSEVNVTYPTRSCNAWIYDRTQYARTAVEDFDLVCDNAFLVGLVFSTGMLAYLISVLVSGIASDYYGRKPVISFSCILSFGFALLAAFMPGYVSFLIFRFITLFFSGAVQMCAFVHLTECVCPKYREITGTLYWCFFSIGYVLLPVVAYYITDYQRLQIAFAVIMLPSILYFFIIPESPRWFVMNNRFEEAEHVLEYIAAVNRRSFPRNTREIIESDIEEKSVDPQLSQETKASLLFTNSILRKTILLNIPGYIACSMLYNGLSYNVGDLSGNIYVNTFISGFLEIPANFVALLLMNFIGRQKTVVLNIVLAGAFCLLSIPFTSSSGSSIVTGLALAGKTCISVAFCIIGLYTAELVPTNVRSTAFGICTTCGSVAGMITPYMGAPLIAIWTPLPLLIFGLVGVIAGPILLFLPETKNKDLPDSLEDAENLWKYCSDKSLKTEMTKF